MNFLKVYKNTVSEILDNAYHNCSEIDPALTNRLIITVRVYFVLYCYVSQKANHRLSLSECINWANCNLSYDTPFQYVFKLAGQQVNDIANRHLLLIDNDSLSLNVGELYESLLNIDISENNVVDGNSSRNKQGSYYSPMELASYLSKSVIDNFVQVHGAKQLRTSKIIDFSCGSGVFLTESISYIAEILKFNENELTSFVQNVFACDVDFIALEISKFNIMDLAQDYSIYKALSANFRHANFLLDTNREKDSFVKIDAYLGGFIYHEDLAIGVDFLTKYDIILGNPPWEKIRFEEKGFYRQYVAAISEVNFKFDLHKYIDYAETTNQKLETYCKVYKEQIEKAKTSIKKSPRFAAARSGELNTSNLFTEAAYNLMSTRSSVGLIIKSSTVAATANKLLFNKILNNIVSIYDFINKKKYFNIDGRERYALLMLDNQKHDSILLAMNILEPRDIDVERITVTKKDLHLLNPSTKMIPNLASSKDLSILVSIYEKFNTISDEFPGLKYGRLVHFTNHASDINKEKLPDNLAVYEGKFFSSFNGAYAGFNHVSIADRYKSKAKAVKLTEYDRKHNVYPESRFYIKEKKWKTLSANYQSEYMLAWHSLTSATNSRACVATILPFMPASQSVQFLTTEYVDELIYLCCLFNSVVFDYIVKNKLTGIDLTQSFLKQIAIPGIDEAKGKLIEHDGKETPVFSLLYGICYKILKDDHRLDQLWTSLPLPENLLPDNPEELLMQLDVYVSFMYKLTPMEFDYIFTSYSVYSPDSIKRMKECLVFLMKE